MRRKLTISIAVLLAAIVCVFGFTDFSFLSSPFALQSSPMIAYRITGREGDHRYFPDDAKSIHGYGIVRETTITDPQLQHQVLGILHGRLTYGTSGNMCFEPGIALRLGTGKDRVDVLICLGCKRVWFFANGDSAERILSKTGVERFRAMYPKLFPGHTLDEPDAELDRIAAARDAERDRQDRAKFTTSQP